MTGHWWVNPEDLDDYQQKAVALAFGEDHLITGPPGSGKTNLLVLRATNLIRNAIPNVVMLVFNRTLEEFIAHCPTPYSIPRDKLKTMQRWQMELIVQLGGTPATGGDFTSRRAENCAILAALVKGQKLQHLFDVILLDECQDYLHEEVDLVFQLAKNVFAVGDDRQQIYDHVSPIKKFAARCKVHNLPHHYRNGQNICILADRIGENWSDYVPLLKTSQYNERILPSRVTVSRCADIAEQAAQIISSVRLQLKAYPNEMIGVLSPRRAELDAIHGAFQLTDLEPSVLFQSAEEGYLPFTPSTRICICTLHAAKGLEFRAAHIAGAEFIRNFRERQRRLAYTSVTRAKTILALYHSKTLPGYLESGLSTLAPVTTPVVLKDLFKANQ